MSSENSNENIVKNELPKVIQTLERYLDFKRWGFTLAYFGIPLKFYPCIVYRSEQCLIRFIWDQGRPYAEPRISTNYARLHAPFDQNTMIWDRKLCYCWHIENYVVSFLDGLNPATMSNKEFMLPKVPSDFYDLNKDKKWDSAEYTAREQEMIWNLYGNRIFDLFDLRRPDLWTKYANFLKEYYMHEEEETRRKGRVPALTDPPLYQVC